MEYVSMDGRTVVYKLMGTIIEPHFTWYECAPNNNYHSGQTVWTVFGPLFYSILILFLAEGQPGVTVDLFL